MSFLTKVYATPVNRNDKKEIGLTPSYGTEFALGKHLGEPAWRVLEAAPPRLDERPRRLSYITQLGFRQKMSAPGPAVRSPGM